MKLIFTMSVVVLQTVATPIAESQGIDEAGSSIMFVIVGFLVIFGVLLAKILLKWGNMYDYTLMQIGQGLVFLGMFGCFQWFDDQRKNALILIFAAIFITVGNSIGITMVSSVYSKSIGVSNPNKGALMGWLIMMAALARILGPILAAMGYGFSIFTIVNAALIFLMFIGIVGLLFLKSQVIYLAAE